MIGKQEILEKALYNEFMDNPTISSKDREVFVKGGLFGSKWQQERSYSEEEVKNLIKIIEWYDKESDVRPNYTPDIEERIGEISMWDWFEQFKKK